MDSAVFSEENWASEAYYSRWEMMQGETRLISTTQQSNFSLTYMQI